ncbi:MAG: autotransporter outer membrane beta-barrel domain-containing protein, partial [Acidobacteriota bacterium]
VAEPDEAFGVTISQAQGAVIGNPSQVGVQILDEDTPMRLEAVGEQEIEGTVREEIPLQVRVLRADGRPVEGALVRWRAEGRAATAGEGQTRSNADGVATQGILLARTPGPATAVAALAGTDATVAFAIAVRGDLMTGLGAGGDPNEGDVADTLDQSCADGDGDISELCEFVFGIDDPDERNEVVDRLTPRGALARNRAALQGPKTQARNVGARMQALRGGGALSEDDAGLEVYDSTESPWGFFLNGRLSFGDAPRRGVEPSYDFQTDGLSAGVDYRLSDRFVFGAALGYLRSDTEIEADRGTIDMEGYSLTLYATYFKDAFYLESSLTYGVSEYDIERVILLPRSFRGQSRLIAAGSPDSDQLSLTVGAGYDFRLGPAATLSGFLRGSYVASDVDSYSETGAMAFNVAYEDQDVESLLGEAGVEVIYPISFSWGVLQPLVRVSFLHEFEDSSEIVRARFVGDPRGRVFDLESERPDRNFFNVAAGFTATLQRGWATYFQYDTDLERDDLDIYTLTGGVRFQF